MPAAHSQLPGADLKQFANASALGPDTPLQHMKGPFQYPVGSLFVPHGSSNQEAQHFAEVHYTGSADSGNAAYHSSVIQQGVYMGQGIHTAQEMPVGQEISHRGSADTGSPVHHVNVPQPAINLGQDMAHSQRTSAGHNSAAGQGTTKGQGSTSSKAKGKGQRHGHEKRNDKLKGVAAGAGIAKRSALLPRCWSCLPTCQCLHFCFSPVWIAEYDM